MKRKGVIKRTSRHSILCSNQVKLDEISIFLNRARNMLRKYVNVLWNNKNNVNKLIDSKTCNKINTGVKIDSRLRQCIAKQASSMVRANTIKQQKRLFVLKKLQKENKDAKYLQRKISLFKTSKPEVRNISIELDSRFVDIREVNGEFNLFVRLSQLGDGLEINIPIKHTKTSLKWMEQGKLRPSVRINENFIYLCWEIKKVKPTGDREVGADQGIITCLTLSDGQVTYKDKHGHDLNSIIKKIANKKEGSKNFKQAVAHRKNYTYWSLNQMNFSHISKVKLEKIKNIRKGKKQSRESSHWTYPLIKEKLIRLGEEKGFLVTEQDNKFRSQRCSQCGWVHKSNRKGKTFKCTNINCSFFADSDLNAASNHEIVLPDVSWEVWHKHLNRTSGFYWLEDGLKFCGEECIVPHTEKAEIS